MDFIKIQNKLSELIGTNNSKIYLDRIVSQVPEGIITSTIIRDIEGYYVKRKTIEYADIFKKSVQESPNNIEEHLHILTERTNNLISYQTDYSFIKEFSEVIEQVVTGKNDKSVIRTGLRGIDKVIGGLPTSEVTIIGGRPAHGKTALAISLSLSILDTNPNMRICFFSLEMAKSQLYLRYLSNLSEVSGYKIKIGELTQEEIQKVASSNEKYKKYENRLFIYDNIYDLATMKKTARSVDASVVIVDYIAYMDDISDENKRNDLGRVARGAKRFAKNYNIAWIYLSQLNKEVEGREGNRPKSSDLGESDQLVHAASDIWLLYYGYKYSNGDKKYLNKLLLIYDKTRHSGSGEKTFFFDPDLMIIKD